MEETISYKCPCCGGTLVWDSTKQKMVCPFCDNEFTEEQINALTADEESQDANAEMNWDVSDDVDDGTEMENMKVHICQSCGGQIVGDENSIATECPYCGSPTIVTENISGINRPNYIIPFKLDKKKAKEALHTFYKGKRLLPKTFADENHIDKVTGVYVPFWLFDCDADAHMTYDATRVTFWTDSEYEYTKTDHYLVTREGELQFEKIPVDGSSEMADNYMDAIEPFDYSQMTEFAPNYLSGYFANKYDVDAKASIPRANERVTNSTEQTLTQTVIGYDAVIPRNKNVNVKSGNASYTMFPVWMLNTKYRDKIYTFAMNGQTGKMVGELPTDNGKFWRGLIGIAAGIFAIAQIFVFLI